MAPRRVTPDTAEIVRHQKTMTAISEIGEAFSERLDASEARTRQLFDEVFGNLKRIETRVAQGETDGASILTAVGAVEIGLGELRDLVGIGQKDARTEVHAQVVERAAMEVSREATAAIAPAIEKAAKKSPLARARLLWVAAISGAFTGTIVAIEHVPETIRGIGHILAVLAAWKP